MFKCGRDEAFPDADLEAEAERLNDILGWNTQEKLPHFRVATSHKQLKAYLENILEPAYLDTDGVLRLPPDAGNAVQSPVQQSMQDSANRVDFEQPAIQEAVRLGGSQLLTDPGVPVQRNVQWSSRPEEQELAQSTQIYDRNQIKFSPQKPDD